MITIVLLSNYRDSFIYTSQFKAVVHTIITPYNLQKIPYGQRKYREPQDIFRNIDSYMYF